MFSGIFLEACQGRNMREECVNHANEWAHTHAYTSAKHLFLVTHHKTTFNITHSLHLSPLFSTTIRGRGAR